MALKKSLHSLDFYLRALFQYKANLLVFDFQFISNGLMVQKKKKRKKFCHLKPSLIHFPPNHSNIVKLQASACDFTKSNTLSRVFFYVFQIVKMETNRENHQSSGNSIR